MSNFNKTAIIKLIDSEIERLSKEINEMIENKDSKLVEVCYEILSKKGDIEMLEEQKSKLIMRG